MVDEVVSMLVSVNAICEVDVLHTPMSWFLFHDPQPAIKLVMQLL